MNFVSVPAIHPASAHVGAKFRTLDEEIRQGATRIVAGNDAEAVHDFRVSIRQLRTLLKLSRPLYGRFHADAVRGSFTAMHRATGELRDEEALEETVAALSIQHGAFEAWQRRRAARARGLRRAVAARVSSSDLAHAHDMLQAILILPVHPKRERDLMAFAQRQVETALAEAERLSRRQTDDSEELHQLRIACKQLRYTVEFFEDVLPEHLRALRKPAVKLQKVLGDVHDLDVAHVVMQRQHGLPLTLRNRIARAIFARRAEKLATFESLRAPEPAPGPPPGGASDENAAKRVGGSSQGSSQVSARP
ncbi:CHAD domain-containing protein [Pendulispora rubella]|uniref:CHAD domain-containing protein n=1 Tax=Pendulispora rubella TaxID=2741070 RepID=A0ABZ2L0Q0_9BACT